MAGRPSSSGVVEPHRFETNRGREGLVPVSRNILNLCSRPNFELTFQCYIVRFQA